MNSKSLGTLSLDLIVQTGGFESGMDKAERTADDKTRRIERLAQERAKGIETAFGNMARNIAGPLAAAFGAGTFTAMVRALADTGDQLQKLSTKTGLAVADLSKLQYAASLSDLSNEDLSASLIKLNRVMGDAADGSKEATAALARFGIAPDAGLSAIDAFKKIADRVKATGDEAKIASGLNDVFGRSFATLLPLLKGGGDGLQKAGDELERMGGVMSGDLAAASEAFNDNLTRLYTKLNALKLEVIGPLIPLFLEISGAMAQTSEKSDKLSTSGQVLKTVFETVAVLGANVAYVFRSVGAEMGGIAAQAVALSTGDFKAFSNIGAAMREDAEKARKEVDALSERLLNPTRLAAPAAAPGSGPAIAGSGGKAGAGASKAISEGQRLIAQLKERLRAAEDLTEVEKLEAQFADAKYAKVKAGERDIALGIAGQIDARKALMTELDAELAIVKDITAEYQAQDARLKSLISGTDNGKNTQNMLDEALAESALHAGKIDTSTYDQIIAKLHEVKDEGKDTFKELQDAIDGWGKSAADAIVDFSMTGKASFSDMATSIIKDMIRMVIQQNITGPLAKAVSGWASGLFAANADGGVYSSPGLSAYSGQVVSTPTLFPFAKGVGLMGEAGPEAIMPLSRDSAGRLGVKSQGGGGGDNISINLTINEADGSAESNTSGNASGAWMMFATRIKSMIIDEMTTQKRPGGLLYN